MVTSQKDVALVKAESGDREAWLALQSIPDQAARQALALIVDRDEDLAMRVLALVAGSGAGKDGAKKGVPFRGALYAADRERRTGERFGLHFFWTAEMGPIDSVIGIRDRVTTNIGAVDYHFGPLTAEEAEANGLQLGGDKPDIANAVEITVQRDRDRAVAAYRNDLAAYKSALEAAKMRADILGVPVDAAELPPMPTIHYQPVRAIGIVLAEEMYEGVWITQTIQGQYGPYEKKIEKKPREHWGKQLPFDFKNYSWQQRAETRALRAGFRRVPGALAEYEQQHPVGEGVTFDITPNAAMGREQLLAALQAEDERIAAMKIIDELPGAERTALVETMRSGAYGPDEATAPVVDVVR